MDYSEIVEPIEIDGDNTRCAEHAIKRASGAIAKSVGAPDELRAFLEEEAEEETRQAEYYKSKAPRFYHDNVWRCHQAEAKAFQVMMNRFDNLI